MSLWSCASVVDALVDDVEGGLKAELDLTDASRYLQIDAESLTILYKKGSNLGDDVGAIQSKNPLPANRMVGYYEVNIKSGGLKSTIGIGLGQKGFSLNRQPGWEANSYGYHGDDGKKFSGTGRGEQYGSKFSTGDTVGCGFHYAKRQVFFTLNGNFKGIAFRNVNAELYPTVGLHSEGECVEVNFGQMPFRFDIQGYADEEREKIHNQISAIPVEVKDAHSLVRNYLLYGGFEGTFNKLEAKSTHFDPLVVTLPDRNTIRRLITSGNIQEAISLIDRKYPKLLAGFPMENYALQCQVFIECIRDGKAEEAIDFAQKHLSHFRDEKAIDQKHLNQVVSLLAYADPTQSPHSFLLLPSQRISVADGINSAILRKLGYPPFSTLERTMRHLLLSHEAFRLANGNRGEILVLQKYL